MCIHLNLMIFTKIIRGFIRIMSCSVLISSKKYKKRISILTKSEINCIKLPLLILLSKSAFAIGLKECKWNLFRILVTTVARISTAAGVMLPTY